MGIFNTKTKYIDMARIFKEYPNIKYFMFWSGRERGKSTNTLNDFVRESYENYIRFAVFFRNEKKKAELELYFNSKYTNQYLDKISDGEYNHFKIKAGFVYFASYDDKGKEVEGPIAGFYLYVCNQAEYKSLQYDDVYNILYEEFVTDDLYLVDEVYKFESLLSTVLRERQLSPKCKIVLLGNTLSKVNTYIEKWKLFEVLNFKSGDNKIYEINNDNFTFYLLAWHFENLDEMGGIALSKKGKNIQKGEWEQLDVLLLKDNYKEYQEHYYFLFYYGGFYFDFRLLSDKKHNYFLFCAKRTKELNNLDKIRTIGTLDVMSNLHTKGFTPITDRENIVFNFIKLNKIYFSDADTGTTFYHAYRQLKQDLKNI